MPNTKSARKRLRQSEEARLRNTADRTAVKTSRRKLLELLDAGDRAGCESAFKTYCSTLDKAAKRGVLAKNTAVRRKSRAAEKIRALAG